MAEFNLESIIRRGVETALNKPVHEGKTITEWAAIGMKAPRWISVEDRLPEHDGQYLCVTKINGLYYHQIHLWHGGEWRWVPDVLFWMDLPPMPEEVQE